MPDTKEKAFDAEAKAQGCIDEISSTFHLGPGAKMHLCPVLRRALQSVHDAAYTRGAQDMRDSALNVVSSIRGWGGVDRAWEQIHSLPLTPKPETQDGQGTD